MFLSYYGLDKNLFQKEINSKEVFKSKNYKEMISRLDYLREVKGIGLFIGEPGQGKTYTIRCFIDSLNKDLNKFIYISVSKLSVFEFLSAICTELEIDTGNCYRNDLERKIQLRIKKLKKLENKSTILIIDNADNLSSDVLTELKFLYDFEMDSIDYVSIILVGTNKIKSILNKEKFESFKQRIIVQYIIENLTNEEVKEYIKTRLELSGQKATIFTETAINALYHCSKGNIRKLNNLIITSMIIGYQEHKTLIDEEIIRLAKEEMSI